jgi:hypothetical protein
MSMSGLATFEAKNHHVKLHDQGYFSTYHDASLSETHLQAGFEQGWSETIDQAVDAGKMVGRSVVLSMTKKEAVREELLSAVRDGLGEIVEVANEVKKDEEVKSEDASRGLKDDDSDGDDWLNDEDDDDDDEGAARPSAEAPSPAPSVATSSRTKLLSDKLHADITRLTSS